MALDSLDYAILALDSCNQGYAPYVNHGKTIIGSMDKLVESDLHSPVILHSSSRPNQTPRF